LTERAALMPQSNLISVAADHGAALAAIGEVLTRLKLDHAFVGGVAAASWLGETLEAGSIDVLAVLSSEQKNQVAMMASNRGFRVDKSELEATEELDLIPLYFTAAMGEIRVHVLVASNALYGQMVKRALTASVAGRGLKVIRPEDFALLLTVAGDVASIGKRERLINERRDFDLQAFNDQLVSVGLASMKVTR